LPVTRATPIVSLNEGDTPLVFAPRISKELGKGIKLFLKLEGLNPTGSFKDRGMTLAISKALEEGSRAAICASTGNTSASAAAYSARAGIRCLVLIPDGNVALGKLSQALIHGAEVFAIQGNFDQALKNVQTLARDLPLTLVNSVNPFRIEGQKTAAFEICKVLKKTPDILAIPVGNAGNITAYWKGFKELFADHTIRNCPQMFGFQAQGAAPLVSGKKVRNPQTIATAIRIGNPASWESAIAARDESQGLIEAVSDAEILGAYKMVATLEGIFVEPASAAPIAGLLKLARKNVLPKSALIVAILTGNGLKDPDSAIRQSRKITRLENHYLKIKEVVHAAISR
jgi:threonine synthase